MSWVNKLWNVCTLAADVGVNYATTLLSGVGSLAAMVGGAGRAVAYVTEEQLNASFYGSAYTPGELVIGINIPSLHFNLSQIIPFQHVLTKEGQMAYSSENYISTQSISAVSSMLILGGGFLKATSAQVRKWHDYRDDKKELKKDKIDYLTPPSKAEYRYSSAEAALAALSQASASGALVGGVLSFSNLKDLAESFTYPSSGGMNNLNISYPGPLSSIAIPVELDLKQNTTLEIPILDIKLLIEQTASAKAIANITYGGAQRSPQI